MKVKKLAALVLAGALCMTAFTGCGVDANETIATLGEQQVSAGLANFVIKYQKASYDDVYVAYYGSNVWDMDFSGSGSTLEDEVKTSIMSSLHDLYTLKAHMDDYKVTITDEEKSAISKAAEAFMKDNSEEAIKELGATKELVEEMLTLYTIHHKMYEAIIVDTDREVSDEDANMRAYSIISITTTGYTNDSGTFVNYTDSEKQQVADTIEKFDKALDADDADFKTLAESYKYTVTTGTYAKDDTSLDSEVKKAMDALKEGEISNAIKTEKTTYFAKIDKDTDEKATEENRKAIIEKRETDLYNKVLDGWQKDDGWDVNEKVLNKIDFHHILTLKDPNATETSTGTSTEKSTESTEKSTESTEKTTEGTEKSTEGTEKQ